VSSLPWQRAATAGAAKHKPQDLRGSEAAPLALTTGTMALAHRLLQRSSRAMPARKDLRQHGPQRRRKTSAFVAKVTKGILVEKIIAGIKRRSIQLVMLGVLVRALNER